ncbi:MAG: hypothetical protein ACRCTR_04310 [Actinomycetota bacterium]
MATIKATCPCCGDVELTAAQVRLVVCNVPAWSFYSFTCDRCQDEIRKPAGAEVVSLLRSGGVTAERWNVPSEALEKHDGPAIGYDDLLDFALWLEGCENPLAAVEAIGPRVRVNG